MGISSNTATTNVKWTSNTYNITSKSKGYFLFSTRSHEIPNYNVITLGNWSDAASSSSLITAKTTNSFTVTYAANNTTQLGVWQCTGYVK